MKRKARKAQKELTKIKFVFSSKWPMWGNICCHNSRARTTTTVYILERAESHQRGNALPVGSQEVIENSTLLNSDFRGTHSGDRNLELRGLRALLQVLASTRTIALRVSGR